MKKYIAIIATVLIVIFIIIISHKDQRVKIGLIGPFTGGASAFGDFMQRGLELAKVDLGQDELKNIEIIQEDDMCDGKNAVSVAKKLIEVDEVKYIIGPLCNSGSLSTEKLFEDNAVVSISVGLPSNTIANMGPYHFSFSPEIEYLMKAVSEKMLSDNFKRIAVIHMISPMEEENYKHFVKFIGLGGGNIVSDVSVVKGSTDFKSAILKIKSENPDSIMIIAHTGELNNILKTLNEQGLGRLKKFGIHAAQSAVLLQNKELAEGFIYPYPGDKADSISAQRFNDQYKLKYGFDADPYSANVYDGLKILISAIKDCGYENNTCVQNKLAHISEYNGANGSLSVDERGVGNYKEIMLKIVNDGKFEILK